MAENFFGITDPGKVRENNEDTFIAEKIAGSQFIAAGVIDGVGGYEGGEVAAGIAKDVLINYFRTKSRNLAEEISQAIITANEKIYNENQVRAQQQPMACVLTIALADISNNQFHYAHVGDTRLYLLRDNSLVKVTKDHSFVGFLEDSGRLSEEDAMKHPKRNEINKALGFDPQIHLYNDYIETGSSPFLPGDILLVCSDGLTDMVSAADITSILTRNEPLSQKCQALVAAANEAGGKDNITVVLVQNDKKPVRVKVAKPAHSKKIKRTIETPAITQPPAAPVSTEPQKRSHLRPQRSGSTAIIILAFICVALLAALAWVLFRDPSKPGDQQPPVTNTPARKQPTSQQQKLQEILNITARPDLSLHDSVFGRSITISDTFLIRNDSLHIDGKGMVLRADPDYGGPGIVISNESRSIILENIVLENFDIGILSKSKSVYLMNVEFRNCRTSLQYQHTGSGKNLLSGGMTNDTILQIPE